MASFNLSKYSEQTLHVYVGDARGQPLAGVTLTVIPPLPGYGLGCNQEAREYGKGSGRTGPDGTFDFKTRTLSYRRFGYSGGVALSDTHFVGLCYREAGKWKPLMLTSRDGGGIRRMDATCRLGGGEPPDCTTALRQAPDEFVFRYLIPILGLYWCLRLALRRSLPEYQRAGSLFAGTLLATWLTFSVSGFPLAGYPTVFGLLAWFVYQHARMWGLNRKRSLPWWI